MDKLVEFLGKIVEKLTSAKLIWLLIVAIALFGLTFVLAGDDLKTKLGLTCLTSGQGCVAGDWVGMLTLAALALIVSGAIIWIVGRVKEKLFV